MKYLIVGLGNIGDEYANTRHNIGFMTLDAFAKASNVAFEDKRYGFVADDLSLPLGKIRMRGNGSAGGHNGLKNIESCLLTQMYARIKFGIGNDFPHGAQANFVLSEFSDEDRTVVNEKIDYVIEMIKSFCLQGLDRTMNLYNRK